MNGLYYHVFSSEFCASRTTVAFPLRKVATPVFRNERACVSRQAICRLIDMDNSSGNYFMVYELIEGSAHYVLQQ